MSINSTAQFERQFLHPHQLDCELLSKILYESQSTKTDFSEFYFQDMNADSFTLEESKVKGTSGYRAAGVGVRVVASDKTGFCHSNRFDRHSLTKALAIAKGIETYFHNDGISVKLPYSPQQQQQQIYQAQSPLEIRDEAEIVAMLKELDAYARDLDSKINFVELGISRQYEQVLIISSDDVCAADYRPLIRFNARVIVSSGKRKESGFSGAGGRMRLSIETIKTQFEEVIRQAVDEAIINLESRPIKAGTMPVVLGNGWPGVLLHEAVGHGLEADFNRKGTSVFANRIGEQVASSNCTVVDNGIMEGRRGSLQIDDEGTPGNTNILIENGILLNYMQDKMNSRLMNSAVTGNGRRQSYAHLPMPRMTNTYMLAGNNSRKDIIASVDDGIYAENFGGGQVDITSGNFVFNASLAYKIERGKISYPVKGVSLIGNGPQVMQLISMVGDDLALDPGIGVCGKDGQSVPVGVGQPTLKIDKLVVGGAG